MTGHRYGLRSARPVRKPSGVSTLRGPASSKLPVDVIKAVARAAVDPVAKHVTSVDIRISNQVMLHSLSLVSPAWSDAVLPILYEDIVLRTPMQVQSFLRTAETRPVPDRPCLVRAVTIDSHWVIDGDGGFGDSLMDGIVRAVQDAAWPGWTTPEDVAGVAACIRRDAKYYLESRCPLSFASGIAAHLTRLLGCLPALKMLRAADVDVFFAAVVGDEGFIPALPERLVLSDDNCEPFKHRRALAQLTRLLGAGPRLRGISLEIDNCGTLPAYVTGSRALQERVWRLTLGTARCGGMRSAPSDMPSFPNVSVCDLHIDAREELATFDEEGEVDRGDMLVWRSGPIYVPPAVAHRHPTRCSRLAGGAARDLPVRAQAARRSPQVPQPARCCGRGAQLRADDRAILGLPQSPHVRRRDGSRVGTVARTH